MGTMEQVIERLDETQKKAGEVIRQLEEAESLHKSLDKTRKGLDALAREVNKLITSTRKGVDKLSQGVTAFKAATATIQQSDPAVIAATLRAMETRVEAIASEVSAISEIKAEVTGLKETVARTASVNEERTRAMETRIEAIASGISAISEIKAEVTGLKETVARTASVNEERTRAMIDNAVDEVSAQSLMDRVLGTRRSAKAKPNT